MLFPPPLQLIQATPLSMAGRSALDTVGMAYARVVYVRNESKLQGLSHNLVTTFHEASKGFVDKVSLILSMCRLIHACTVCVCVVCIIMVFIYIIT